MIMRTLLLGGGCPSKGNNIFGGGCLDPQQFMHILWGGSTDPQQFVHILGVKLAVESVSEVAGASKAHLEVVNGPVP